MALEPGRGAVPAVPAAGLLALLLALLVGLVGPSAAAAPAPGTPLAGSPAAGEHRTASAGKIVGRAVGPTGSAVPRAKVVLFDAGWNYLRETRARGTGRFAFSDLAPGTYHVQVSDSRPRWNVSSYATTDGEVRVGSGRTSVLTVRMKRGAFITGQVQAGPRNAGAAKAWVRASDAYGRSYEVRADARGRFALGGLPQGSFQLWGYDAQHRWVGKAVAVTGLRTGTGHDVRIPMRTRAGGLSGFLFEGPQIATHRVWVTAVSKRTGQWWVVAVRTGDLSLPGLAPGRYTISMTGTRTYAGRTVTPSVSVRPGTTRTLNLKLTQPVG